jgi:hypothetical protein
VVLEHWAEGREAARARGRSAFDNEDIFESNAVVRKMLFSTTARTCTDCVESTLQRERVKGETMNAYVLHIDLGKSNAPILTVSRTSS